MMIRPLTIVMAVALYLGAQPAIAFSPNLLNSVVSVLPVWPSYNGNQVNQTRQLEEPEGTAVAIKPDGYLVTNFHVIRRALSVSVRLRDGRLLPAEIIGGDILTDLALIKIAEDIAVLPFGHSRWNWQRFAVKAL